MFLLNHILPNDIRIRILTIATFSFSAWRTNAFKIPYIVNAGTTVPARIRCAIVDVYPAIRSGESKCAFTQEPINAVYAFPTVIARLWGTIVNIILAMIAFESISTDALVVVASVDASTAV